MHKDAKGREIHEGGFVQIISIDPHWFSYLSEDAYTLLQDACKHPVKVDYLDDDGKVSLELPPTLESDGYYVGNSISIHGYEVLVVELGG